MSGRRHEVLVHSTKDTPPLALTVRAIVGGAV